MCPFARLELVCVSLSVCVFSSALSGQFYRIAQFDFGRILLLVWARVWLTWARIRLTCVRVVLVLDPLWHPSPDGGLCVCMAVCVTVCVCAKVRVYVYVCLYVCTYVY